MVRLFFYIIRLSLFILRIPLTIILIFTKGAEINAASFMEYIKFKTKKKKIKKGL